MKKDPESMWKRCWRTGQRATLTDEDKTINRLYVWKVFQHIQTSHDPAVKRIVSGSVLPPDFEESKGIQRVCKRFRDNDDAIRTMSSDGALKLPHPEVKRLRGSLDSGLLLMHPQLGPIRGEEIVRDRELWICDYRLGFPTFSPVVVDPHFVRRSGRLVRPKSGIPLCELQLMWDCWDC